MSYPSPMALMRAEAERIAIELDTCPVCDGYISDEGPGFEGPDGKTYCTESCALLSIGLRCRCCDELHFESNSTFFCPECAAECNYCKRELVAEGPARTFYGIAGEDYGAHAQLLLICQACSQRGAVEAVSGNSVVAA